MEATPQTELAGVEALEPNEFETPNGVQQERPASAGLLELASPTGFEPAQAGDSGTVELGEEDHSITGSNFTDNDHT